MTTPDGVAAPLVAELEQEAAATEQMLRRLPADRLTWKPHDRSMSLGQLALHVATIAGGISNFLEMDSYELGDADFSPAQPASKEEIMAGFAEAQANARAKLEALTDAAAMSHWRLMSGDQELWSLPKIALARTLMFNHLYHHRGQLSVYLRLLDVPVPATYGRSADESQFT